MGRRLSHSQSHHLRQGRQQTKHNFLPTKQKLIQWATVQLRKHTNWRELDEEMLLTEYIRKPYQRFLAEEGITPTNEACRSARKLWSTVREGLKQACLQDTFGDTTERPNSEYDGFQTVRNRRRRPLRGRYARDESDSILWGISPNLGSDILAEDLRRAGGL